MATQTTRPRGGVHRTPSRRRTRAAVAVSAVGVLLAAVTAGSAVALWSDSAETGEDVVTGMVAFSAGRSAASLVAATGAGDDVSVTIGSAEATTLVDTGALALPLTVSSLAQGNRGLRYEIALPTPTPGTVLGATDLTVFPVTAPAECTTAAVPPPQPDFTSASVPATYTDTATPTEEYWCLYGTLDEPALQGTYTNIATVTAESAMGHVSDTDSWSAGVLADPASEPDAHLTFSHETYRPNVDPQHLTDNFTVESQQWMSWSSNVRVSSGRLMLDNTRVYSQLTSSDLYDLENSSVCARAYPSRAASGNETFLSVGGTEALWKRNNNLEIAVSGSSLFLRLIVATTVTDTVIPYDATAHAWWRIREDAGTVYWETSPDGATWTTRRSAATPFPLDVMRVRLYAGNWSADSGTSSSFDDVNHCG